MTLRRTPEEQEEAYLNARLLAVRAWGLVGCAAVFVIAVMALGQVMPAVISLAVGCIVGFVCSSMTNWLERKGVGRGAGAMISLVVVLAVVAGLLVWVGPLFFDQFRQLLEKVPSYFTLVQDYVQKLFNDYGNSRTAGIQENVQSLLSSLSDIGTTLVKQGASWLSTAFVPNMVNIANNFVMGFMGLIIAFWFAKDYPTIMAELGVIAGPRHGEDLSLLVAVLARSVGGYMRGIVITSVLNGVLVFLGLLLCGHPYAGLMGIITCIMHFVPVVGPAVSALLATLAGLFVSPVVAAWSLVWSVIAQNVTDNLISPLIMQSAVKIHPAMSLIGITVGAGLGGPLGMALAVPLTAAVKGAFIYFFESKTGRQLVSYEGAFFKGTPYHHEDGSPVPSFDALDDDTFLEDSRIVETDVVPEAVAEEKPEGTDQPLADALRQQLEEFKRLHTKE